MRTTLTLDDDVALSLKERAYEEDASFKAVVNRTLRAGLAALSAPGAPRRYVLHPSSMGGVAPGIDLARSLRLAERLEDDALAHKFELRK